LRGAPILNALYVGKVSPESLAKLDQHIVLILETLAAASALSYSARMTARLAKALAFGPIMTVIRVRVDIVEVILLDDFGNLVNLLCCCHNSNPLSGIVSVGLSH